jgi:hypothetical protein
LIVKTVLLDTNTLLLWIVGHYAPERIGRGRLAPFGLDDFKRMVDILEPLPAHVSVPGILVETSNFLGSGEQQLFPGAAKALATYCQDVEEIFEPSRDLAVLPVYERVGLTDTAILYLADQDVTVLTTDHELFGRLSGKGVEAVNLLHFKTPK